MDRLLPVVTVRNFSAWVTCYAEPMAEICQKQLEQALVMPIAWRQGRLNKPLMVRQTESSRRCTSACGPACCWYYHVSACPCPARSAASRAPARLRCSLSSWSYGMSVLQGSHGVSPPVLHLGCYRANCATKPIQTIATEMQIAGITRRYA